MANEEISWTDAKAGQSSLKGVPYRIHSCSTYSKDFTPAKIIPNRPEDHTSRWSCAAGDDQPWLLLELIKPAVLYQVTIGKYKEDHPCNAQSVRILAGNDPSLLEEVSSANLRNDSRSEMLGLRHSMAVWKGDMSTTNLWDLKRENDNIPFPVRYVKIVPGRAYEPRYNVSLWHVKFEGVTETDYIERVQREWFQAQKLQKDRLVLKHLRCSPDLRLAFQSVLNLAQQSHGISTVLEHPGLTLLFDEFVVKRDYRKSEEILEHILEERLAKEYEELVPRKYSWRLLGNSGLEQPSVRGGHAMCAYASTLWLFGGNGRAELNDFWRGSLRGDTLSWTQIQRGNGPWPSYGGRNLMVATEDRIYMIALAGKQSDDIRIDESFGLISDELTEAVVSTEETSRGNGSDTAILWMYEISHGQWKEISRRNWDCARQELSSFSCHDGQLIVGRSYGQTYSVAIYDIGSGIWNESVYEPNVMSRASSEASGSLVRPILVDCFDSVNARQVLVSTSHSWPGDSGFPSSLLETVQPLIPHVSANASHRSFVDFQGTSLLLITGLEGGCIIPSQRAQTVIHVYSIARGEWQKLNGEGEFDLGFAVSAKNQDQLSPVQKCGHEMTYDRITGRCIFYGGRTDGMLEGNVAVELALHGLREVDILRKCKRIIRRQSFIQILLQRSSLEALSFLQETLSPVTAPSDAAEQQDLRALFTALVRGSKGEGDVVEVRDVGDKAHLAAFQQLLHYISPRFKEPVEEISSRTML
ncbi:hypothetical protein NliqN6_2694 [Naganishia liquefaciens]|uniref:Muskelin N-terminal domain-containing protein n=1 Tax=Naganishia liquefaciens TaxID=104408 RepID=A0A8H3YFK2_9TREE|nr:hypothetical protein NliqN6_2694 [Naganishia liquefaciens]